MALKQRWSDLSPRTRKLLIVGGIAEAGLKTAALIDIKRRPASDIRGSKWMWVPAVIAVNSLGAVPLSYFAFGRRKQPAAD